MPRPRLTRPRPLLAIRFGWMAVIAFFGLLAPVDLHAADLSGGGAITFSDIDNRGLGSRQLEQQYSFSLFQELTPYLRVRLGYSLFDQSFMADLGGENSRRSQQPGIDLLYGRRKFNARLSVLGRDITTKPANDGFEGRSYVLNFDWRPVGGLGFQGSFRDEVNVADQDVFGRDAETKHLRLETFYDSRFWGLRYIFGRNTAANTGLESDQDRHEVRGNASRSFFGDKLGASLSASAIRVTRETRTDGNRDIADPIPPTQGLFVIDTSPEVGNLEPAPTLINGDVFSPAVPRIDIGAANTFRNVGIDVALTQPVTQLQVFVDGISGTGVIWQAYHSRDNLFWEPIFGAVGEFEPDLLRYVIRFPETSDRFFKAVNVSPNTEPEVLVTEIRALLNLETDSGISTIDSERYRGAGSLLYRISKRVVARADLSFSDDENLSAGFVRRDFKVASGGLGFSADISQSLRFQAEYRRSETEDRVEPELFRTLDTLTANLLWTPLPTLQTVVTASRREEFDEGDLLISQDTVRLRVVAQILPDIRSITDLDHATTVDPFTDGGRTSQGFRQSFQLRPFRPWQITVFYRYALDGALEGGQDLERTGFGFSTTWVATSFLSVSGNWSRSDQGLGVNTNQSASISYSPGDRLIIGASYQEFSTEDRQGTRTESLRANYRLYIPLILSASLSRSRSVRSGLGGSDITSLRFGIRFSI